MLLPFGCSTLGNLLSAFLSMCSCHVKIWATCSFSWVKKTFFAYLGFAQILRRSQSSTDEGHIIVLKLKVRSEEWPLSCEYSERTLARNLFCSSLKRIVLWIWRTSGATIPSRRALDFFLFCHSFNTLLTLITCFLWSTHKFYGLVTHCKILLRNLVCIIWDFPNQMAT